MSTHLGHTVGNTVGIDHTLDFIGFYLPKTPSRVLEVGCGHGELARAVAALGHEVVALDTDEGAVTAARAAGVAARREDLLSFVDATPFETILFAHSLHHIHPLKETLRKAHSLLAPHGIVVIEDFAWEEADEATLRFVGQSMAAWEGQHKTMHRGEDLVAAAEQELVLVDKGPAPYLYRYAEPSRQEGLLLEETALIAGGALRAVGLRIVAKKR